MNHSYKTCRNHESLFLKLGNQESLYFGSGITNDESLRKAQQNRYELIAFDPGIAGYGVSASQNLNCFFTGEHADRASFFPRSDHMSLYRPLSLLCSLNSFITW